MYSDIYDSIRTKHELDLLFEELSRLKESIYETKAATFEDKLKTGVRDFMADMIRADLRRDENITKQEYIEGLERELKKVEVIRLTIAFDPTEDTVEKVFEWVHKNIGKGVVIHFQSNPKVVGGAIVEYKGKFHDNTLTRTLDDLFEAKSEEIIGQLQKTS